MKRVRSGMGLMLRYQIQLLTVLVALSCAIAPPEVAAQGPSSRDFASGVHVAVPLPSPPELSAPTALPFGGANIVVNSPTAGAQNETTIAVNPNSPNNLLGGANDYRGGDSGCGRYFTTDTGLAWTDLSPFPFFTAATDPTNTPFTVAGDPGVAFDANGHGYYLCMYFTRTMGLPAGGDATQFVHKSSDGGMTWGPPVQVSAAAARSHFDDKGHIAVDNKSLTANRGNVYVAWARLDQNQIRFARSTTGAASFDADIQVNDALNAVTGANIAVGVDGAVYVAWWDFNGVNSRILIDKSTNGGQAFGALTGGTDHVIRTFTGIGPVRPLSRVNSFPVIATDATDANVLYAVWAEDPAGADDSDIMFARSTDGGNTWGAPIRINDDINLPGDFNSQFFPWMAVDPTDGSINIVWYDNRLDPDRTDATPLVDLFFASSTDQGLSFGINLRVSTQSSNTTANFGPAPTDFFGDYNAIAAYGGVAYPLWTDSRTGDQDVMTTQIGGADLSIAKTDHPDPVTAGGSLFYDLTVSNAGPAAAFNVTVTDTLPTGVVFVGDTGNCAESPAGTLTCSLGNLGPGETIAFTIQVQVNAGVIAGTTLTNTATVDSDQDDPTPNNNTVTAATIVNALADLRLTKDCKPDAAAPSGSTAVCTIFVDNLGLSDAHDVVVTDTHFSNGSFTISSATFSPPGSPCAITNGVVTCSVGTVPAGGRITIVVELTSNDEVDVNDVATVTGSTPDPNQTNNLASDGVRFVGTADLGITKVGAPDPVEPGDKITYTLTVTNAGPSAALNVVVTDTVPKQVSQVTITPSQGICVGKNPITCNLGTIAAGTEVTIIITGKVDRNAKKGSVLTNNASVSSNTPDPNNANNIAAAAVTVKKPSKPTPKYPRWSYR